MLFPAFITFLIAIIAFALSSICGGGAGLILIPLLGYLLPVNQIPAALSIGTFTSSASRLFIFFKKIRWDIVKRFVPAALPFVLLGTWLLNFVNPVYLEFAIGAFLISNLPFLFKKKKKETQNEKPLPKWSLSCIGASAGFLSGLTGAVGVIFNRFYLRYGLKSEEIVATRAANEIILHVVKIVLYTSFGLMSSKAIFTGLIVATAAVLSSIFMKKILPKISLAGFKKIGYVAMVASGFVVFFKAGDTIAKENQASVKLKPMENGINSEIKWQSSVYSLEMALNGKFEFEKPIDLKELPEEKQKFLSSFTEEMEQVDKVLVEAVFKLGEKSYEAYFYENEKLVKKIHFL